MGEAYLTEIIEGLRCASVTCCKNEITMEKGVKQWCRRAQETQKKAEGFTENTLPY